MFNFLYCTYWSVWRIMDSSSSNISLLLDSHVCLYLVQFQNISCSVSLARIPHLGHLISLSIRVSSTSSLVWDGVWPPWAAFHKNPARWFSQNPPNPEVSISLFSIHWAPSLPGYKFPVFIQPAVQTWAWSLPVGQSQCGGAYSLALNPPPRMKSAFSFSASTIGQFLLRQDAVISRQLFDPLCWRYNPIFFWLPLLPLGSQT
jgi:hypothetical protein